MDNKKILIVAIVFIALSSVAYLYPEKETDSYLGGLIENEQTDYPFRLYSFPLLMVGIILLVVDLSTKPMKGGKKS